MKRERERISISGVTFSLIAWLFVGYWVSNKPVSKFEQANWFY
jgi:uncharacterized protein YneF (UPF0154 family)